MVVARWGATGRSLQTWRLATVKSRVWGCFLPSGGFLFLHPNRWRDVEMVVLLEGSPLSTQQCWRSGRAEALGGVPVVLLLFLIPASMRFRPAGVLKMTWIVRPYIGRCVWIYQVEPRCRNTWSLMSDCFKQTISLCHDELLCVRFTQLKKWIQSILERRKWDSQDLVDPSAELTGSSVCGSLRMCVFIL